MPLRDHLTRNKTIWITVFLWIDFVFRDKFRWLFFVKQNLLPRIYFWIKILVIYFMEIIEFLKTKLMHILNRESFHAPKIKQNLAVIIIEISLETTGKLAWHIYFSVNKNTEHNNFYCIVPVVVTNEWLCEVIGSHP